MKTFDFVRAVTEKLNINEFNGLDVSLNGLQVGDYEHEIKKVAFAVDACQASIDRAVKEGADLLFVHHGLFWGKPLCVTGPHYKRIKTLLDNEMGLFACHLPLDAHPVFGNNAEIARELGLVKIEPFCDYMGKKIGCKGVFPKPLICEEIIQKMTIRKDEHNVIIKGGKEYNETIAIVSGSAASDLYSAVKENVDCFMTGEAKHSCYHDCFENKINMLALGHYETETYGVRAVMEYVSREMSLETCFIDNPTRL